MLVGHRLCPHLSVGFRVKRYSERARFAACIDKGCVRHRYRCGKVVSQALSERAPLTHQAVHELFVK